jgi:hypothetical protein
MTPAYLPPNHKNFVNNNPFATSSITPQKQNNSYANPFAASNPFPSSPALGNFSSNNNKYDNGNRDNAAFKIT